MRKLVQLCASLCALVTLISATPVRAQSVLWVSNVGLDTNTCTQTSPCATFQGAINRGGASQINCLTSGNYGPFVITASITVDCGTGNIGSVFYNSSGVTAITINTSSTATVILRHLSVNGNGVAGIGINTQSFPNSTLIVEDCMIHGFRSGFGSGIKFFPSGVRGLLQVSNTQIFDNTNGIMVAPSTGQIASVTLDHVEMVGNDVGLNLTGSGVVAGAMRNSIAGSNGSIGVVANSGQVFFTVEESTIVANLTYGIQANSPGAIVNVGASTIGGNGTGLKTSAGQLISFGNNQFSANGTDGNFTSTKALK